MISSLVKGTFNDTIVKEYILTAVKVKLIPPTPGATGAKWGTYSEWLNRQDSLEHFSRCTPHKKRVPWKHLYFSFNFPAVSMYSSVKRSHSRLDFQDTGPNSSYPAVLDKISKQLVLQGRGKGWMKSSWATLSYGTRACPCPGNANVSCWH